jgi:hypothetical protein
MTLIKGIASIGAAMLIALSVAPARAGYVVDLTQVGSDVVAKGSGAIDLTGLGNGAEGSISGAFLDPFAGGIITGPFGGVDVNRYPGGGGPSITGPSNFGSGGFAAPSSGSGDLVGVSAGFLYVPAGYVSDNPLSDAATYLNQTISSLGATPGTYKWTWGDGADQNFTLVIGAVVPEPSTWAMMLLGFAALGLIGYRSTGRHRPLATLS